MSASPHPLLQPGVIAPGTHDALSAVLAKRAGFNAAYVSGFAFEATQLGAPDMAISTMPELLDHAARIVEATGSSIICDIDTGFGGPNSVHRTVRAFERAGVAAVQIEDQAEPKRCPFLGARTVVSREQGATRIRIASEARRGSGTLIIARTDADSISMEEVIARCNLYGEAGADLVFPMVRELDGVALDNRKPEERMQIYRELAARIDYPIVTLDPPPGFSTDDLFAAGASLCILPLASLEAATSALSSYYTFLASTGASDAYFATHTKTAPANVELMRMLGLEEYLRREAHFFETTAGVSNAPSG